MVKLGEIGFMDCVDQDLGTDIYKMELLTTLRKKAL